ncbi:DEAD-domain-containing protein [Meredithblackwellia eburnea MCA 4105]
MLVTCRRVASTASGRGIWNLKLSPSTTSAIPSRSISFHSLSLVRPSPTGTLRLLRPVPVPILHHRTASTAHAPAPSSVEHEVAAEEAEANEVVEDALAYTTVKDKLQPALYRAVTVSPFQHTSMTPVQGRVLSLLPSLDTSSSDMSFPDLLVRSKTGTGKTISFLLPMMSLRLRALSDHLASLPPTMQADEKRASISNFAASAVGGVIISPTRELASQIAAEAKALSFFLPNFGVRLLVGGESRTKQMREWMKRGASNDLVVATPGRLVDLMESERSVRTQLEGAGTLVLDEADTLLDMGFSNELDKIQDLVGSKRSEGIDARKTLLFSATVSKKVKDVASGMLKEGFEWIDTVPAAGDGGKGDAVHAHVPQFVTLIPTSSSTTLPSSTSNAEDTPLDPKLISHILHLLSLDALNRLPSDPTIPPQGKAIIFLPTTRYVQLFSSLLQSLTPHLPWGRNGTAIFEIHSKKDQSQRSKASAAFRASKAPYTVLVTSDVSARGVDYPNVTQVIQVGIPSSREIYIHRVGRTGRAGKEGRGDLVLMDWEKGFVKSELKGLGLRKTEVDEVEKEVMTLAEEVGAQGERRITVEVEKQVEVRRMKYRSKNWEPRTIVTQKNHTLTPPGPRLSTISSALTTILPSLPELDVNETFASLLGYYIPKSPSLDLKPRTLVECLKDWCQGQFGGERQYVGEAFLKRLGVGADRPDRGGRGREMRGGKREASWTSRGSSRSSDDRSKSRGWEDRPRSRDRDDKPRSRDWNDDRPPRSFRDSDERSFSSHKPRGDERDGRSFLRRDRDSDSDAKFGYGGGKGLFSGTGNFRDRKEKGRDNEWY